MTESDRMAAACSPVQEDEPDAKGPEEGIALCLSGGGYRAMLFHVGALWRLNELGYLPRLDRVSSVSGGSITAATLASRWGRLEFDTDGVTNDLGPHLVKPVRRLAGRTIDQGSVLGGIFTQGTIADKVAGAYRRHLFGRATLQDLPDHPRFVVNATNVQTGRLWRFSKPYMADYRVGMLPDPDVELAVAVAASSAFPPVLSPLRLKVDPARFAAEGRGPLHVPPYTTDVVLSDGGVYDNLGLETAWKRYRTILISDGGGQMVAEPKVAGDWPRHAIRINSVIDDQVRNLRKRQAVAGFKARDRQGAYWGIRTPIAKYGPPKGSLPCPAAQTAALAATKTRLRKMDGTLQERLINWGYAVCDAAMRRWVVPDSTKPARFPYPARGVG
jgi:NTE family protein